ncbi:hypothetical protein SPONN_2432 [uncultured Candidatus Thioglobus sp.]|nr:hypothetical protein SPONN_2432 [uncultured Candidatus Thioglobus sp.]
MDFSWVLVFQIIETAALIAAVFVARFAIKKQRETVKKDKTITLLMNNLEDKLLIDGIQLLLKIHLDEDDDVAIYANKSHKKDKEFIAIRNLLNYYENVAIGAKADIYDIGMIKKAQKTMISHIFSQSKPFIDKSRKADNNPNLYIEFEDFIQILAD